MLNHYTRWRGAACFLLVLTCAWLGLGGSGALLAPAQGADAPAEEDPAGPSAAAPDGSEDEATSGEDGDTEEEASAGGDGESSQEKELNYLRLVFQGGLLMIPIGLMALLVATFGIERIIGLRRSKVMPYELVEGLGQLSGGPGGFDPRKAYRLCQRYPSAASTVIRAMLLKVGRPHSEVEHAVAETSEREAERLYTNVRWLSLAAAVTPLMGLLGTVLGMIDAFFQTTLMQTGANKSHYLAQGIYVALVTTLGGLAVAIPAAILAHLFEGRIQSWFHRIDEMLFSLLPQIERYEGRLRVSHQSLGGDGTQDKAPGPGAGATGEKRTAATVPE